MGFINNVQFGLSDACNRYASAFTSLDKISHFGKHNIYTNEEVAESMALSNAFLSILIITGIVIGFMAVPHLCPDQTDRGKNVRLGLYFILLLTGGQLGWFFGLLWAFKINFCA